jgi:hypothetical protein
MRLGRFYIYCSNGSGLMNKMAAIPEIQHHILNQLVEYEYNESLQNCRFKVIYRICKMNILEILATL